MKKSAITATVVLILQYLDVVTVEFMLAMSVITLLVAMQSLNYSDNEEPKWFKVLYFIATIGMLQVATTFVAVRLLQAMEVPVVLQYIVLFAVLVNIKERTILLTENQ